MRKKIIFAVTNDLTYDQRMQRICTSLANWQYEVLLVGRRISSSIPLQSNNYSQKRFSLFFSKGKLFYIEFNIRLFLFLLFRKFDIVCAVDLDTVLPCLFISKWKGITCVYDAHELFHEVPEVVDRPLIKKFWLAVERFALHRIKSGYTVSESIINWFHSKYPCHFTLIRSMPHKSELAGSFNESEPKFILYQGALNKGRGIEQIIEAMAHLPLQLKLAGEGDLSNSLRLIISNRKLKNKVDFLGRIAPAELIQITKQAFIGFNLLDAKGLSYQFSLANKFFDYTQAGIPQITMNFPEYRKMNEEFEVACLIDDIEPHSISTAIHQLLDNKDYYFRLRKNCLLAANEWTWQQEEVKLLAFYQNLK